MGLLEDIIKYFILDGQFEEKSTDLGDKNETTVDKNETTVDKNETIGDKNVVIALESIKESAKKDADSRYQNSILENENRIQALKAKEDREKKLNESLDVPEVYEFLKKLENDDIKSVIYRGGRKISSYSKESFKDLFKNQVIDSKDDFNELLKFQVSNACELNWSEYPPDDYYVRVVRYSLRSSLVEKDLKIEFTFDNKDRLLMIYNNTGLFIEERPLSEAKIFSIIGAGLKNFFDEYYYFAKKNNNRK